MTSRLCRNVEKYMRLFFHCCPMTFNNCYLIGADEDAPGKGGESNDAVIIDPGFLDTDILRLIASRNYTLKAALVTHDHPNHVHGLSALRRIYDIDVYAAKAEAGGGKTIIVRDGETFSAGPFRFEVISVPGHSPDSLVFKTGRFLFTGDSLTAGMMGATMSSYGAMRQITVLQNKVFSLPGNYIVLGGHGPPSSLEAERRFNTGINRFERNRALTRRRHFSLEFLE